MHTQIYHHPADNAFFSTSAQQILKTKLKKLNSYLLRDLQNWEPKNKKEIFMDPWQTQVLQYVLQFTINWNLQSQRAINFNSNSQYILKRVIEDDKANLRTCWCSLSHFRLQAWVLTLSAALSCQWSPSSEIFCCLEDSVVAAGQVWSK